MVARASPAGKNVDAKMKKRRRGKTSAVLGGIGVGVGGTPDNQPGCAAPRGTRMRGAPGIGDAVL
jgi:hypothetical protein